MWGATPIEHPENYPDWRRMMMDLLNEYHRTNRPWEEFRIPHNPMNTTTFVEIFNAEKLRPLGVKLQYTGRDFTLTRLT